MKKHIEAVEALLEVMNEHDLDALKLVIGETTYELVRREAQQIVVPSFTNGASAASSAASPAVGGQAAVAPGRAQRVIAPLVGVFYRSSAPDSAPFVNVGDRVEVGQVLCILEAMKLMNEITSDFAGIVTRVIPENSELVSIGEDLFWIEP